VIAFVKLSNGKGKTIQLQASIGPGGFQEFEAPRF